MVWYRTFKTHRATLNCGPSLHDVEHIFNFPKHPTNLTEEYIWKESETRCTMESNVVANAKSLPHRRAFCWKRKWYHSVKGAILLHKAATYVPASSKSGMYDWELYSTRFTSTVTIWWRLTLQSLSTFLEARGVVMKTKFTATCNAKEFTVANYHAPRWAPR